MKKDLFSIEGKHVVITGGGGMLGYYHAAAVASYGAHPILLDIDSTSIDTNLEKLYVEFGCQYTGFVTDVTSEQSIESTSDLIATRLGRVDVLINNAARNPKVEQPQTQSFSRLEHFPETQWGIDLDVGLGGAFRCSKVFGSKMIMDGKGGVIINISSDLGVIAPDQRLYKISEKEPHEQPVKPVTYSVVKHGLIGLTKYLATYWCEYGVRCNALSPGGVYAGQSELFLSQILDRIPLGRLAQPDEYMGAIVFLCSDSSSYLNGANLVMDGGRSVW